MSKFAKSDHQMYSELEKLCGFMEPCDNSDLSCPDGGCVLTCNRTRGHEGPHSIHGELGLDNQ